MKLLVDQNLPAAVAERLTNYLATQRRRDPSVVIVRQFTSRDDVAGHLVTTLAIVESTIMSRGSAVFTLAPDKPIRVELLPLGSPS